jgi:multidrug efflux pump subunit AcrB
VLRLRDVARIELAAQNYDMESRVDGSPAAVLAIFQQPGANADRDLGRRARRPD